MAHPTAVLGIDVAKHAHTATLTDPAGQTVEPPFTFPNTRAGFAQLAGILAAHRCIPASTAVGLEATGHYGVHLVRFLKAHGYPVAVLNPLVTQGAARTAIRQVKTDRTDASRIAALAPTARPSWTPTPEQEALRRLTRLADRLRRQHGLVVEQLTNLLDGICPEFSGFFPQFAVSRTARAVLERWSDLRTLDRVRETTFLTLVRTRSRGRFSAAKARQLLVAIRTSVACEARSETTALELRLLLAQERLLADQLAAVKARAVALAQAHPAFPHLTSIPGVSPFLAAVMLAEVGDLGRFDRADQLTALAGLDPSVKQSGRYLRRALYYAAQAAVLFEPELRAWYRRKRAEGKPHRLVLCAVARKLLGRVVAVWREGRMYRVESSELQQQKTPVAGVGKDDRPDHPSES